MGNCCGTDNDDRNDLLARGAYPQRNNIIRRESEIREITIHNDSDIVLWYKTYDSNGEESGNNKIAIWSKDSFRGSADTKITAWYYSSIINFGDGDEQNIGEERKVWDRKPISPHQDIFIFDGNELTSEELSFNIDIVNTRNNVDGYIANGEYFILPARYYRESSLMDNGEVMCIRQLRHSPQEIFKLTKINEMGYCNITTKRHKLLRIDEGLNLQLADDNDEKKEFNVQFRIEKINNSEFTVKISSRYQGYLIVNRDNTISTSRWDPNEPGQRFFLQRSRTGK